MLPVSMVSSAVLSPITYRGPSYKTIFREAGNGKFKTYEEGLQCSKDIKAAGYVESSALLNEGIHNVSIGANGLELKISVKVFYEATNAFIESQQKKKTNILKQCFTPD